MTNESTTRIEQEGMVLLISSPIAFGGSAFATFYGTVPDVVAAIPMFVWILWFTKWAVQGGIPPGMVGR